MSTAMLNVQDELATGDDQVTYVHCPLDVTIGRSGEPQIFPVSAMLTSAMQQDSALREMLTMQRQLRSPHCGRQTGQWQKLLCRQPPPPQ